MQEIGALWKTTVAEIFLRAMFVLHRFFNGAIYFLVRLRATCSLGLRELTYSMKSFNASAKGNLRSSMSKVVASGKATFTWKPAWFSTATR